MSDLANKRSATIKMLGYLLLAGLLIYGASQLAGGNRGGTAQAAQPAPIPAAYQELLQLSLKEKKGLTFFMGGQTVGGVVVRVLGDEAVEIRNQTYSRLIIRLESVDGLAIN